jgi:hypothetical protein
LAVLVPIVATGLSAQSSQAASYKLLDAVVFFGTPPTDGYSPDVLREVRQFTQRADAYRPRTRPAGLGSEMKMVYAAREGYETKLVAIASGTNAERLAQQYVDALRPCYEWEGFSECPEREAKFAEEYLTRNPQSPFREFLPLLIAHRWLCAAAGYEMEERAQEAVRSRRAAAAPLATALNAKSLLIRTSAQELKARDRCYSQQP